MINSMKAIAGLICFCAYVAASADTLPIISTPPQSLAVAVGSNVVLSVTASGATSYQWRFNGTDLSGATGASLTVSNSQVTNSGYYVVIAKNALGWVPSLPAYLSVVDTSGTVMFGNRFHTNAIAVYGPDRNGGTSG